ncbi:MAG: ABC transporter substrate-binding protein [Nitrospira sp.]|nr:ABC transporter substrate-binding protein [Nitrospira sp.]
MMTHGLTDLPTLLARVISLVLLILALLVCLASAESNRIVVLSGQDLKPYQEVLAGLQQSLAKQGITVTVEIHALQGNQAKAQSVLVDVKRNGAKLVITLGNQATQAVVREINNLPILATMIVSADDIRSAPNATAVLLDFPIEAQLQWLKRIIPNAGTVGVLFNPKENQLKVDMASTAAKKMELRLAPRSVETPRALPDALDEVTRTADVLWGIPDSVVMTPHTAEPILLSTLKSKVPFVGLSTSWVKAGALYALDRDYLDIGVQTGELAGKLLSGTTGSSLPPMYPRKVTYVLNLKTANVIKLELPPDLIKGALQVFQ